MLEENIKRNIRKIMSDRGYTQASMAEFMNTSESQFSKILSGKVKLSLAQLESLASNLSMREIDIITYPEVYLEKSKAEAEPIEALLQIKLRNSKKNQVLKMLFGEDVEILNNV